MCRSARRRQVEVLNPGGGGLSAAAKLLLLLPLPEEEPPLLGFMEGLVISPAA